MVSAQTLYGMESEFSNYQENPMKSRIDNQIEANILYHLYNVERINGDYHTLDFKDTTYPFVDKNEWMVSAWSDWTEEEIELKEGRKIEKRTLYQVQRQKKVRYFYLYDVRSESEKFQISELSFYLNGEKLDVTYECDTCTSNYQILAQNQIIKETPFSMEQGGMLKVDLQEYYPMEQLEVIFALYDEGYNQTYNMVFDYKEELDNVPYYNTSVVGGIHYSDYSEIEPLRFNIYDFCLSRTEWDFFVTLEPVEEDAYTQVTPILQRRYQDTLYQFYREEKRKTQEYYQYPTAEYPYIDYESGKVFYHEKRMPTIVINDHVTLYHKGDLEKELILFSNVPYQIIESIDYEKNGLYEVEVITDFSDTNYLVELKLFENEIRPYQNEIIELERETTWRKEENQKLSDLLSEKEEEKQKLLRTIQSLEEEIQVLKEKNEDKEKITLLEKTLLDYETKEKELELEISVLESQKSDLESKMQFLENKVEEISNQNYDNQMSFVQEIKNDMKLQETEIEKLKEEDKKIQELIEEYQKKVHQHNAFHWMLIPIVFFPFFLVRKKR